jgi:tetratricopeptide (TPR) repeat protein
VKQTLPKPSPAPAAQPKHGKKKWGKYVLASIFLVFSLSFLTWRLYLYHQGYIHEKPRTLAHKSRTDFNAYRRVNEKAPSVMEVAPQDMYRAFLYQYRLRPDMRFIKTLEILAERFGEYHSQSKAKSPYTMGEVLSNGEMIVVPLLKKKQPIAEIRVPLPITFSRAMATFDEWLASMEKGIVQSRASASKIGLWQDLENVDGEINTADPRAIIRGLIQLENLWRRVGPEATIFRAASRGYSMLLMVLIPDKMDYRDILAAYALSFLAMAKRLDPNLPLVFEEALLATNMGYTAHAANLLKNGFKASSDPIDKTLEAFLRKDLEALKGLQGEGSRVLGYYLLARLYREMGMIREAEDVGTELFKRSPDFYPAVVEIIYSGRLASARRLTTFYPLNILAWVEGMVFPKSFKGEETWQERVKSLAGEASEGDISLSQFDSLMKRWRPLGGDKRRGFVIDEDRIKTICRTLYSDALFLKFSLLLDQLAVVERAETYARLLAAEDDDHPVVMEMLAEVSAKLGNRKEADELYAKIINHPHVSYQLAMAAFYGVDDLLTMIKLAPTVAHTLDGRPENLFSMGKMLQELWNYDLAAHYYILGLNQNPHNHEIYEYLSLVRGNGEPLSSASKRFPNSFKLMELSGDYYAEIEDPASKQKALTYYEMALKLVPSRVRLPRKKAKMLRQLGRHGEAAQFLSEWIEKHGRNDLSTAGDKAHLANTYLEMGKPQLAWEAIADWMDSYKAEVLMVGAKVHEHMGKLERAEEIYRQALKRYPTSRYVLAGMAAFLWRQGRNEEAAEMVARGQKGAGQFTRWYFEDFLEVFVRAPKDRILEAVGFLIKHGAAPWEIRSLGFRFHHKKRPDVALGIIQKTDVQEQVSGERLQKSICMYEVLRDWKGQEEAIKYLRKSTPDHLKPMLTGLLGKSGLFELILTELSDPQGYPPRYGECLWLQRLIAWLALGKKPPGLEREMIAHYEGSSPDYYHEIGRYLLGMVSRNELLGLMRTSKQCCEFAYYIGLSERLQGNFTEATNWYHLCLETLLQNNGEFHLAYNELSWWSHMGTGNRHRLVGDDIRTYRERGEKRGRW